jgi:mono/diheme cytochrome c family protein
MLLYSGKVGMVKRLFVICSMAAAVSLPACSAIKGNPENGRRWYSMNNCSSCHGEDGRNGLAPSLAGMELGLRDFMKNLRKPTSVSKPTYSETDLSKQDAVDIYVWLQREEK